MAPSVKDRVVTTEDLRDHFAVVFTPAAAATAASPAADDEDDDAADIAAAAHRPIMIIDYRWLSLMDVKPSGLISSTQHISLAMHGCLLVGKY